MTFKLNIETLEDLQNQQVRLDAYYETLVAELLAVTGDEPVEPDPENPVPPIPTDSIGLISYLYQKVESIKSIRIRIQEETLARTDVVLTNKMMRVGAAIYELKLPDQIEAETPPEDVPPVDDTPPEDTPPGDDTPPDEEPGGEDTPPVDDTPPGDGEEETPPEDQSSGQGN